MKKNVEHPPEFTARALLRRFAVDFWLKAFGTTFGMSAFFVLYFALMRHPIRPPAVMPVTWIDGLLPFFPWAVVPYISLWVYISLVPAFLVARRELWAFAFGCLGLSLAGCAVFYVYPTTIPPPEIDWEKHRDFLFFKNADLGANACPSLHVAFAVFIALWFERILPSLGGGYIARAANLLWAALIVYSTIGTRQHVALDALWGAPLGAFAAAINFIAAPCRETRCATPRPLFLALVVMVVSAALLPTAGVPVAHASLVLAAALGLVVWHLLAPNAQGLVRVHSRFRPIGKEYWLTIDDGPDPGDTPLILDELDRHAARATFFFVGKRAAQHPELVEAVRRRGHEVAHHSHTHPMGGLWNASPSRLTEELDRARTAFGEPAPTRFRPPIGIKNLRLAEALARRGLACVGWTIRSGDSFARDPEKVAARVLRRLRPGAIVLLHEGPFVSPAVRVAAIRLILERASAEGYRAVVPPPDALIPA